MDPQRPVHSFDPLRDPRWTEFVRSHPRSSVFHSPEWLRLLADCYDYVPVAYTTAREGDPLENAILFCRVRSWITGNRLVSLPFSDHCEPLVETPYELEQLLEAPRQEQRRGQWRYVEMRPLSSGLLNGMERHADQYVVHILDLRPPPEYLTPEEVWAVVGALASPQDQAIVLTMAMAGLRPGEAVAIMHPDTFHSLRDSGLLGPVRLSLLSGAFDAPSGGRSTRRAGQSTCGGCRCRRAVTS